MASRDPRRFAPFIRIVTVAVTYMAVTHGAWAEEKPSKGASDLAKASQNPVAAMISVPFENNATFNNGPNDDFVNASTSSPSSPWTSPRTGT